MKLHFILFLILLISLTNPQAADANTGMEYKYYDGYGYHESSVQEAREMAYQAALQAAIRENYGFSAVSETESFSNDFNNFSLNRAEMRSRKVKILGFELEKEEIRELRKQIEVKARYRYKVSEIELEKQRLSQKVEASKMEQNQFGEKSKNATRIDIETKPQGALVKIDGEIYGRTPLTIYHVFEKGYHDILLDHPMMEPHQESILTNPGSEIQITRTLQYGRGTLQIECPNGGEIKIMGRPLGTCNKPFRMLSGVSFDLKVEHRKYLSQTVGPIILKHGDKKFFRIEMVPLEVTSEQPQKHLNSSFQGPQISFFQKPYLEIKMSQSPSPTQSPRLEGLLFEGSVGAAWGRNFGLSYSFGEPRVERYGTDPVFTDEKSEINYLTYWFYNERSFNSAGDTAKFFQIGYSTGSQEVSFTNMGRTDDVRFPFQGLSLNWAWQSSDNAHLSIGFGVRRFDSSDPRFSPATGFFLNVGMGLFFMP